VPSDSANAESLFNRQGGGEYCSVLGYIAIERGIWMRESTFSFWEAPDFKSIGNLSLQTRDFTWQPVQSPTLDQQWQFEARFDQGIYLNTCLSVQGSCCPQSLSHITCRLYVVWPDGKAHGGTWEIPMETWQWRTDTLVLHGGDSFSLQQNHDHWTFTATFAEISVQLLIKEVISGFKPGRGVIAYGDEGEYQYGWVVPQPRCFVEGVLKTPGKGYTLSGTGYLDYRHWNFDLPRILQQATWGRVYTRDVTVIWGDVMGNYDYSWKRVLPYFFGWENNHAALTSASLYRLIPKRDLSTGMPIPHQVYIQGNLPSTWEMRVEVQRVLVQSSPGISSRWQKPITSLLEIEAKIVMAGRPMINQTGWGVLEHVIL